MSRSVLCSLVFVRCGGQRDLALVRGRYRGRRRRGRPEPCHAQGIRGEGEGGRCTAMLEGATHQIVDE